jgi:hypothetical protein
MLGLERPQGQRTDLQRELVLYWILGAVGEELSTITSLEEERFALGHIGKLTSKAVDLASAHPFTWLTSTGETRGGSIRNLPRTLLRCAWSWYETS